MFCLSGRGSVLTCDVFPALDISGGEWEIGLVGFTTFNSIPNIEEGVNNKFHYGNLEGLNVISIPEGSYEIEQIESFLLDNIKPGVDLSLRANNSTLQSEITCNQDIYFDQEHTVGSLLGFSSKVLRGGKEKHFSDRPVDIIKVNTIRVECNIVRGSYNNGSEGHTLHEVIIKSPPGFKIFDTPQHVIYLPVNTLRLNNITVSFKDQDGNLINFRDEVVSVRLHLRRSNGSGHQQ